jgi:protein-S-isoprenylcysteine O-methyltransferase Ste14
VRRPALGTALFAVFGPPVGATVFVPWLLTDWALDKPFLGWDGWRWLGSAAIAAGTVLIADSMIRFARVGRGTPAPWAAPTRFVATGFYRVVRNPMYVGVLAVVIGEALLFGSVAVLIWAALLVLLFHIFVVFVEEPSLASRLGAPYEDYRRRTGRWLPRIR